MIYNLRICRSLKNKNLLAVTNSIIYDEAHKSADKTVPHQATGTGEIYALSTKAVSQGTDNEPPLLYAYAIVDTQRVK